MDERIDNMEDYEDILHMERPVSERHRMETVHRAKQFAPFAALKGFEECVRKKEIVYIDRPVLAEEQKELIDQVMKEIVCGMEVHIEYYEECRYLQGKGQKRKQTGKVQIWEPEKYIQVDERRIEAGDILDIFVG